MKAVLRVCMPLLTLLLAVACGGDEDSPEAGEGPDLGGDTGGECTDAIHPATKSQNREPCEPPHSDLINGVLDDAFAAGARRPFLRQTGFVG